MTFLEQIECRFAAASPEPASACETQAKLPTAIAAARFALPRKSQHD
jgi:hypothetical protein